MIQNWFKKAKLGVFIHWGIYAVDGIAESWSFGMGNTSYDEYMTQLQGFNASKYDPKKWAKLFKKFGANYVVLTSKHHDGVALFDTKYSDLNVIKRTPAGRDLIAEYCEAMREEGLKTGIYFSNTDWSSVDHLKVILNMTGEEVEKIREEKFNYVTRWRGILEDERNNEEIIVKPEQQKAWKNFMTLYKGQIKELLINYGEIDLLWFDVMIQRRGFSWDAEGTKNMIETLNDKTVINKRLGGYGDYETPELYIPVTAIDEPWELCTTFNDSWGFKYNDNNYKDVRQIIRIFCECISKGGNMLISVGPDAEGEIPKKCEELMLQMGEWTSKYSEAIYPTNRGIGSEYFLGGSTLTEDRKTLYLFAYDISTGYLMLNGIRNKIKEITALKNGKKLKHTVIGGAPWVNMPGSIWINVEDDDIDDICTVIKIEFDEEIDLVEVESKIKSYGEM